MEYYCKLLHLLFLASQNWLIFKTLDEILGQLNKELSEVEGENVAVENEVGELQRRCVEGRNFIFYFSE